jgi:cysteinyl-tRNA synthetase
MADLEGRFVAALDHGETREAVAALLDMDSAIVGRLRHGEDSPDLDSASAMFRSLIVRLGDGAAVSAARDAVDELVDGLVEARDTARANRDFATADRIRERLAAAGIEVRDGANGSSWVRAGAADEVGATGPAAGGN